MKLPFSFHYRGIPFAELAPQISVNEKRQTVYRLSDGLSVTLEEERYPEKDASYWFLRFENNGKENSGVLSDIFDGDFEISLPEPDGKIPGFNPGKNFPRVTSMKGMVDGNLYWEDDKLSATEYKIRDHFLFENKVRSFRNITSRSSDGTMPFFDLHTGDTGAIIAVGWTGGWQTEFARTEKGASVKTGLQKAQFYMKPGESLRTSSVLVMHYSDSDDKYNKFRALMREHFSHKSQDMALPDGLFACEMWGGLPSKEMKKRIGELHEHGVSFEQLWIDAGWYGQCEKCDEAFSGDWARHTGEWEVNRRVHSTGLHDVRDVLSENNQRIMLWIEPERVAKEVALNHPVFREHPEYFMTPPDKEEWSGLIDYGNPAALDYVFSVISHYIDDLGLSCYRQDFNCELDHYTALCDAVELDRTGIAEIKHINGLYELFDRLHEKYPHLLIDNCAAGGRRFDIEMLRRSIAFFRSDYQCAFNACPEVLQTHNANASLYLPYAGCTTKAKSDDYAVRSCYNTSFGIAYYNAVFQSMEEEDFAWAKKNAAEYRRIRRYFSCDFYNHGSYVFDLTSWAIWQYHNPVDDSGVVLAFRRPESPFEESVIELRGLLGNDYVFEVSDAPASAEFENRKLRITLSQKRSSAVITYRAK